MLAAKRALEDLSDRTNLTDADIRLRTLLIECGRKGGVSEAEIKLVSQIGAYWANGMPRKYPRKEQWAEMKGGGKDGVPGQRVTVNQYAKVTHVIPLDPVKMGGKTKAVTLRERTLYKVRADSGNCYQWIELERSHLRFRHLKKGERVLLRSGLVKEHAEHEGVWFTEFERNDVDLLPNQ
jgi:hypothetical protein